MRDGYEQISRTERVDVTGTPEEIRDWRSHRFVRLGDQDPATRYELARLTVPEGSIGIVRRVWQMVSLNPAEEDERAPQIDLVTDPAYFIAIGGAGQLVLGAPLWHLVVRREDGARAIPANPNVPDFPDDSIPVTEPLRGCEYADGWRDPNGGNGWFLYPWGTSAATRIVVSPGTSLSLFVDTSVEGGYRALGGLLEGELREIVNTENFWRWYAQR